MSRVPYQAKRGIAKIASKFGISSRISHYLYQYRILRNKQVRPSHAESDAINSLVAEIKDGDVFWDVGAMGGSYTRYVRAACFPEAIHAFEPNPLHIKECERTITSLPGEFKKVTHQIALSDDSGSVYFATEMPSGANTSAGAIVSESELSEFDQGNIIEVPVESGDHMIQSLGVDSPDILKIDVEGAEMNVLRGLLETFDSKNIRVILCEIHLPTPGPSPSIEDFGYSEEDIFDFLNSRGYSIEKVSQRNRDYHILATKD